MTTTFIERRKAIAGRLRLYHDAIKALKALSDADYLNQWVAVAKADTPWVNRMTKLAEFEQDALLESERLLALLDREAA